MGGYMLVLRGIGHEADRMATAQAELVQTHEYIDEDGLSERYLIPPRTAQRWRAEGGGPAFVRLGPRRVVYRISDIERWLAERTFKSRADELARYSSRG